MADYFVRALRTFIQSALGTVLTVGLFNSISDTGVLPGWSAVSQALVAVLVAGGVAVLSFTQNYIEDRWSVSLTVSK